VRVRPFAEEGKSLTSPPAEGIDVFRGHGYAIIGVGEQTGAMDAMLQKIADFY